MTHSANVMVTGAAGFIGCNLIRLLRLQRPAWRLISYDALTYAGHRESLPQDDETHIFVRGDVADAAMVRETISRYHVTRVIHLAAESHVDRSITDPLSFVQTNVVGTATLLKAAQDAWANGQGRFLHVSTDEVFGALGLTGKFTESSPYDPRSPYSASKAGSDHLARAWYHTYQLPVIVTNCTNNYGPYQFPEKLVPLVIDRALRDQPVPVYGAGENVRDWLYVEDHCAALLRVLESGTPGETYCIGGDAAKRNVDLVEQLLDDVDRAVGRAPGTSRALIRFVEDRPGHDFRYATDFSHLTKELGWRPTTTLAEGLERTVRWYLDNADWLAIVQGAEHERFQSGWYQSRGSGER